MAEPRPTPTGTKRARPKRGRNGALTREDILEKATKMIAERGYRNTTMKAVAAAVGVTEPAVYRHFQGKEQLLLAVFSDTVDRTLHPDHEDPSGRPLTRVTRQLEFLTKPESATLRRLIAEMYAAAAIEPKVGALAKRFVDRATKNLMSQLSEAVEQGDVSPDINLAHACAAIFIFETGLAHHETLAQALIGDEAWSTFITDALQDILRS